MKRIAIQLFVFMLLGAITTVAVAWGCALWSDVRALGRHDDHEPRLTERVERLWRDMHPPDFPDAPGWTISLVGSGVRDTIGFHTAWDSEDDSFPTRNLVVREIGWPMRSMQAIAWHKRCNDRPSTIGDWMRLSSTPPDHSARSVVISASLIPFVAATNEDAIRLIPLFPLWIGFAVNTAIYACAWWSLRAVVRKVSRRRGFSVERTVIRPLAFLTAGALVSVVVAGGCYHFRDPQFVQGWCEGWHPRSGPSGHCFGRSESFGLTETLAFGGFDAAHPPSDDMLQLSWTDDIAYHVVGEVVEAFDRWSPTSAWANQATLQTWEVQTEIEIGWPRPCVAGVQRLQDFKGAKRKLISALPINGRKSSSIIIPVRPGLGFAVNSIFYGATLWLMLMGASAMRRVSRRLRGRCAGCGYDLRHADHEVCPECGVGTLPTSNKAGERRAGE